MKALNQQMSHVLTSTGGFCSWGKGTRANRTHTVFPGSWLDKRKTREAEKEEEEKEEEGRKGKESYKASPEDFLKEFSTTLELRMTDCTFWQKQSASPKDENEVQEAQNPKVEA